jgi:hypothetical protein
MNCLLRLILQTKTTEFRTAANEVNPQVSDYSCNAHPAVTILENPFSGVVNSI